MVDFQNLDLLIVEEIQNACLLILRPIENQLAETYMHRADIDDGIQKHAHYNEMKQCASTDCANNGDSQTNRDSHNACMHANIE